MNKEEFKKQYCLNSKITEKTFDQLFVVLPCNCNYEDCEGWAAVNNISIAIEIHNEMYKERDNKGGDSK